MFRRPVSWLGVLIHLFLMPVCLVLNWVHKYNTHKSYGVLLFPFSNSYVGDTHLVKGLDYGLLNKVRNEIVKKRETPQDDPTPRGSKEKLPVSFCTAYAKAVYQWIIKPQTTAEQNDMFLPERMAFLKNMWYSNVFDIRDDPTTHILNIIIMPGSIKKHG
ncbi:suppressor of mec-8 and unc-52 protein homolog 2 [Tanacetum coccineum]